MQHPWNHNNYTLNRQVFALTGKVRILSPSGYLCCYAEQKMFRWREDIRVYADSEKHSGLLIIQARQVFDFAASYDVFDSRSTMDVGALRRRGFQSIVRDQWEILSTADNVLAKVEEDDGCRAALRRFLLGSLLPQTYHILLQDGTRAATFSQRFNLFRYEMDLAFHVAPERFDRRLGLSMAILLAIIEGKQGD